MSTLGYGDKVPVCPIAYAQLPVMLVHGGILDAIVFGIVLAKFSAPSKRGNTFLISGNLCGRVWIPVLSQELANRSEWSAPAWVSDASEPSLCISFRMLNVRDHAVMQPELAVFLVDHCPLMENGDLPVFRRISFEVQPPMHFLEFPCTVTCTIQSSDTSVACPLHDLLRKLSRPGVVSFPDDAIGAVQSEEPLLASLSLMAIFSGSETVTGSCFEVRRTWTLSEVQWGHQFVPMLTAFSIDSGVRARNTRAVQPSRSLLLPNQTIQTTLDIEKLDFTEPLL